MRMVQHPVVILVASLVAVAGLSGCGKRLQTCKQDNKDYVGAKEMPSLKAPAGLESPDTRAALRVPVLNTPERVRGRDEPCLDAPPPFDSAKTVPTGAPAPQQPPKAQ
jgi:uncharacterized lipoprotein